MRRAFTLIELLIVVAIIAILAAIAVPNFLEAQVRAKVSRTKADMRSVATAFETYAVDTNVFPPDITDTSLMKIGAGIYWYVSNWLTTPISYISSNMISDPFRAGKDMHLPELYRRYRYVNYGMAGYYATNNVPGGVTTPAIYKKWGEMYGKYRIISAAPDGFAGARINGVSHYITPDSFVGALWVYDPTNGTMSVGDVIRSHKEGDHKSEKL